MSLLLRRLKLALAKLDEWPVRRHKAIDGFISPIEAACLYRLAKSLPANSLCCEIGIWKGRSAYCIALGLSDSCRLFAVDPFDATGDADSAQIYRSATGDSPLLTQFLGNMRDGAVLSKIEVVQGRSEVVKAKVPSNLDLLFIDADHSIVGCTSDYRHYFDKIKDGGYLVFHDYDSARKSLGPTHVIETMVLPSQQVEFVDRVDRIWIGRKLKTQSQNMPSVS